MKLDEKLEAYPSWRDLWRSRIALLMLAGGVIGARLYFGAWKNPVMDFSIWAPTAFGMAALLSQAAWQTMWPNQRAKDQPLLSGIVFLAVCLLVALVVG